MTLSLPLTSYRRHVRPGPVLIVGAPYESSMGLVQKIFYFHFSSWMGMFAATVGLRRRQRARAVSAPAASDITAVAAAELVVVFGMIGLITGTALGPQGVGRLVDMGRARDVGARAVADLRVVSCCCGDSAGQARSGCRRRLGCSACSTCRSSTGRSTCGGRCIRRRQSCRRCRSSMGLPLWFSTVAFLGLFTVLLAMRTRLERRRVRARFAPSRLDD